MNSEHQVIGELFMRPAPKGRPIRWWHDDHQGGGWIEYITREEDARRVKAERELPEADWWWE